MNIQYFDEFHNEELLTSIQPGNVPPIVSWIATELCNMRCSHCYPESSPEKNSPMFYENQHYKIVEILAHTGIKCVIISGGEPMLIQNLPDLVQEITTNGMSAAICTNGSLVTYKNAKTLKESGLTRVSVSIDGTNEKIHDSLRLTPGAFRKAIQAIKIFSEVGIPVFADYTITSINSVDFGELISMVKNIGAKGLRIKRFLPIGRGQINREILSLSMKDTRLLLDEFLPYDSPFCKLHDPIAYSYFRVVHNYNNFNSHSLSSRLGCQAGLGWFAIQPNGDITPCPLLRIAIGNILDDNLKTIFSKSDVIKHILNRNDRSGACGTCQERTFCGGCRAHAFALSGDYLSQDPLCIIADYK